MKPQLCYSPVSTSKTTFLILVFITCMLYNITIQWNYSTRSLAPYKKDLPNTGGHPKMEWGCSWVSTPSSPVQFRLGQVAEQKSGEGFKHWKRFLFRLDQQFPKILISPNIKSLKKCNTHELFYQVRIYIFQQKQNNKKINFIYNYYLIKNPY